MIEAGRSARGGVAVAMLVVACWPGSIGAQEAPRTESVTWQNPADGMELTAVLTRPAGDGPFPGVVLHSIAGTSRIVERLVDEGHVVLTPVRRGFVAVEPLLRATYADLAGDVRSGVDYLRDRPEVDRSAVVVVAQADDAPPAMLASAASDEPIPLVLFAPPAFSGTEVFRMEQRTLARRDGASVEDLQALDDYVERIARIALGPEPPDLREYRLGQLRATSPVELPRNAAFPEDERQAHFFASPLWRDRLAFEPEVALAALRSPVLVMIGVDDPNTPLDAYLYTVRRGFVMSAAPAADLCIMPGRTRHSFTEDAVDAVARWLTDRGPDGSPTGGLPAGCLPDPDDDRR